MADELAAYEPLDLSPYCNAGLDVLGDDGGDTPTGEVTIRGLPFLVGSADRVNVACLIAPAEPITVPVGRSTRRIIVAHRQLAPTGTAGRGIGTVLAHCRFHLSGDVTLEVPIRDRPHRRLHLDRLPSIGCRQSPR